VCAGYVSECGQRLTAGSFGNAKMVLCALQWNSLSEFLWQRPVPVKWPLIVTGCHFFVSQSMSLSPILQFSISFSNQKVSYSQVLFTLPLRIFRHENVAATATATATLSHCDCGVHQPYGCARVPKCDQSDHHASDVSTYACTYSTNRISAIPVTISEQRWCESMPNSCQRICVSKVAACTVGCRFFLNFLKSPYTTLPY